MSEEEKEAIKYLKKHIIPYNNINGNLEFLVNDVLLNLIEKLQKENEELEKTIDLIIDDFQMENYFIGMTNKEVREYYKKRKELKE